MAGGSIAPWPAEVFGYDPEWEDHFCYLCKAWSSGGAHQTGKGHQKKAQNIHQHLSMEDLRRIRDEEREKIEAFNRKKQEAEEALVAWREERFGSAAAPPPPPPQPAGTSRPAGPPPPPPAPTPEMLRAIRDGLAAMTVTDQAQSGNSTASGTSASPAETAFQ